VEIDELIRTERRFSDRSVTDETAEYEINTQLSLELTS
jgi:hypothetical protein